MRISRLPHLVALLLLGATVLVGCGSESESDDSLPTSLSEEAGLDDQPDGKAASERESGDRKSASR